ncbi:unnamed protein product [Hyaloperonospora brassicae]|uniref:BED-type domain-containing protein n=1 Tax=Hyaloperonospora brassicae TaxID=162125 RepID=A0AAV0UY48_HYABA|nr:unnamed protein product [Hyaloperonospora brassicae]
MGRGCSMDEWVHFKKLPDEGRVPNSSYWYVLCRHCIDGYEKKQLQRAPLKLTGRRSAMRSHLKSCPVYATQYRSEQLALQEITDGALTECDTHFKITDGMATTKDRMTTMSVGEKRDRRSGASKGHGKHRLMEEWTHFTRLQTEGYIGNSNFFYAVCKACERAYEVAAEHQKPLLVPEKIVGRREKLRKHLAQCPHFQGKLPPLGRRLHQRSAAKPSTSSLWMTAAGLAANGESDIDAATDRQATNTSTAATMGGVSAGTLTMVSSRRALNEWHFFTRLERKQNSAYYFARCNFCQQALESAPESMKASMKPAIVMGRKSNMRTHLAKCPHVPRDASTITKVQGDEQGAALGSATAVASVPDTRMSSRPEDNRVVVGDVSSMPVLDTTSVHRALVQLLMEHQLPFEWVESNSAKCLFRALVPVSGAADTVVPSAADLRTRVLENTYSATLSSELSKLQELIPLASGTSALSNSTIDTLSVTPIRPWPVSLHCNMSMVPRPGRKQVSAMDGIVTNGKAIVSLAFVRAQGETVNVETAVAHSHGLEVARWLNEHIQLCVHTARLSLAVVVLPYSSIMLRAIGILRAPSRWPQVVFLHDMETMLHFPLLTLLATAEMFTVVSSLIELWQLESIRSCVIERLSHMDGSANVSPFCSWDSCAVLIQVLLDDQTFVASTKSGAANAQRLVENALNRSLLERVCTLLDAFMHVFASCRAGLTLSSAMVQLGVLFTAAEGFATVQRSLEVVWEQMEQPLFILARALNPRLRLRDMKSTALTRLSTLSDLSVMYFTSLFGHRPSLLRGEVTAYLHTSQHVFTTEFVAEFPVVEDYFCYLGDNYPSLSMLMQVLYSMSSVSLANCTAHTAPKAMERGVSNVYTNDEQLKLDYLRDRWGITSAVRVYKAHERETNGRIAAHSDRSGAAMLNADVVVGEWKKALTLMLYGRGVDLTPLEDKMNGMDGGDVLGDANEQADGNIAHRDQETAQHGLKLPTLELDDELTFPSTGLRREFSTKVLLKDLFESAESCS